MLALKALLNFTILASNTALKLPLRNWTKRFMSTTYHIKKDKTYTKEIYRRPVYRLVKLSYKTVYHRGTNMKNTKYNAIIFDMDGTITDTEFLWKQATLMLIERRGITLSANEHTNLHKKLSGMGLRGTCQIIKSTFKLSDSREDLMEEKAQIACDLFEQKVRLFDGFIEFHANLKKHNLKHAIATNADDKSLAVAKRVLSLDKYFNEHIYNISHVNNRAKPDPTLYLYTAEKLDVDPKNCIAIEDSPHGIRAAKDAGMFCIGYNSSKDHDQVKEADIIVNEYEHIDLGKLLK